MPYLNLDLDYFDHPKTRRLIGLLGRGAAELPIRLWAYCGKYHSLSGSLAGYSAQEIESIVGWWGKPGELVEALTRVGFLVEGADGYRIHEWADHNGHIEVFKERAKGAAKQRWERYRARMDATGNATSIAQASDKQCPVPAIPALPANAKPSSPPLPPAPREAGGGDGGNGSDKTTLDVYLCHWWGREGKVGYGVLAEILADEKQHGQAKVREAIKQAAGAKNKIQYYKAVIKGKAQAKRSGLKICEQCKLEFDPSKTGTLCPKCYPMRDEKPVSSSGDVSGLVGSLSDRMKI
jgi:hypothetical protein